MTGGLVRLKVELRRKHLQTYTAFCREYDRTARTIDTALVGTAPGRAQFYRWLSGALKGLPYPHHCRVLVAMFPGSTVEQLFEPCTAERPTSRIATDTAAADTDEGLLDVIENRVEQPTFNPIDWGPEPRGDAKRSYADPTAGDARSIAETTRRLAQRLQRLVQTRGLDSHEIDRLAHLAGHIVDLDSRIDIRIDGDGSAHVTHRYETLNMTTRPLTRVSREVWFKHTDGKLDIRPSRESTCRIAIQRIHDTPTLSKFACQLSPPIQPGESAVFAFTCEGGRFVDEFYWRRTIQRYTRHAGIHVRHVDAGDVISCSAVEEHPDGAENSATEDLTWDYDEDDVIIDLTREYLRPNQAVTLRWEVTP